MNATQDSRGVHQSLDQREIHGLEIPVDAKTAARFLGVGPSLVYAYVGRRQIPHFRMMGPAIRFSLAELKKWLRQ